MDANFKWSAYNVNRFKFLVNGCGKCLKALIIHVNKWIVNGFFR